MTIEPVFVLSLLWTNETHGLFRTSIGLVTEGSFTWLVSTPAPAFWVHATYSYLLLAAGAWFIVEMVLLSDLFRSQLIGLPVGVFIPWIGNGLYLADFVPPGLDPTLIGFTITGFVFLWTISRHRLLALVPLARAMNSSRK